MLLTLSPIPLPLQPSRWGLDKIVYPCGVTAFNYSSVASLWIHVSVMTQILIAFSVM